MDPNKNYNYPSNYMFPNQLSQISNIQNSENSQNNTSPPSNLQSQFFMPPNPNFVPPNVNFMPPNPIFGMQYPYNYHYMQFGQQPSGNNYVGYQNMHNQSPQPSQEQLTPRLSSGSTDIPEFSSQISLGNDDDDLPTSFITPTNLNYGVWSFEQNKALLMGYFHYSNDSELGTGQKGDTYWKKITAYVNENSPNGPHRSQSQCTSHYRDINRKINAWVGAYRKAMTHGRSGWSDDDYISKAQELYIEKVGSKFTLIDEWKVVRNEPKYMVGSGAYVVESGASGSSGSKRKSSADDIDISSSTPTIARPEGREATKKKKAKASGSKARKSNTFFEEVHSRIECEKQVLKEDRNRQIVAMENLAQSNKEQTRLKKMELWCSLSGNDNRDELQEKLFHMLTSELFD